MRGLCCPVWTGHTQKNCSKVSPRIKQERRTLIKGAPQSHISFRQSRIARIRPPLSLSAVLTQGCLGTGRGVCFGLLPTPHPEVEEKHTVIG